ncbi:MAG TPA: DUF4857 domain-containing protein [Melioribacteraceae bacterium]|nr:DUF4857 domain-containing protein [Melioribacteraceae bacterium]
MIIKTTRYLMLIIAVIVISIYLPQMYWKLFNESVKVPLILYSPIIEKFLICNYTIENKFVNENGKIYTRSKFESLEPIFYFRQLVTENRMPDTIRGKAVDFSEIKHNNFRVRIIPQNINAPLIKLYPLFESRSGRANLSMPEDVFRINDKRIEFIDCYSNTIDEEKSEFFTEALLKEGFVFPSKMIFGNPTTRKPFDEGYFIIDNEDKIFQLKMVKGMPYCKNINAPKNLKVKHMSIIEMPLREFYGVVISEKDELYLISYNNYNLINVPVKEYNSANTNLVFRGDLFFRIVQLVNDDSVIVYAYNKNYKQIDRFSEPLKNIKKEKAGVAEGYLFPFVISTDSASTSFIDLYFRFTSYSALIFSVILMIFTIVMYKVKGYNLIKNIPDFILVGLTGIYGVIAILVFIPFDKTK